MTKPAAMTSNRPYLLRAVHEWICDNGLTPYVVADATQPDLRVPPQAISEGRVVLNLAPRAVTHLEIGNDAITFMARFGGVSHAVTLPIAAVQAIYARENGQGMLLAEGTAGTVAEEAPESSSPSKSPLQSVPTLAQDPSESGAGRDAADGSDPDKPRPKGKPSLHVVK